MKRKIFVLLLAAALLFGLGAMTNARAAEPEMTVSQQFLDVLKKWEGFSATPYKDNGQYTFGYGCKCPSDQVKYYTENPLTLEQAEELLKQQLSGYEQSVRDFADRYDLNLQQHQFDALVSFTYNCGGNWLSDRTGYINTAVREMNTGAQLIYALGLWSNSAGRYILINRRMKEANMFINGEYDTVPSSYGWVYLNGGAGTTSYKIFCYDAGLKTPLNVEFKHIPTGTDANGKPFAYTLAGWYTESGKKVEVLDSSLSRGQTLYARWADPSGKIVNPTDQSVSTDGFPKSATVVNVSATVNARTEPTTDSNKSGALNLGSKVTVVEEVAGGTYSASGVNSNVWCKLSDDRYVAKYYLRYAEESIASIKLVSQPAVTEYHQPIAAPRLEGSVLLVSYTDGGSEAMTVKKSMISGFNGAKQGKQTVTVTYGGKTTSFSVKVLPPLLKITAQPTDAYATAGNTASITVKASGEGLRYTWYHKNANETSFTKVSLTGATYSVKMSSVPNGRLVYCVVTDKQGNSVTSNIVQLHLVTPVKITAQPQSVTVAKNTKATVRVSAVGDGLTYTWYHKNAGASAFAKLSGNTPTYTATMTDAADGRYLCCIVSDRYGNTVKSDVVRIFLDRSGKITVQPVNGYAPKGKVASVTVKATGDDLSYAWYHKNATASKFAKAPQTGATYKATMTDAANGRYVYCIVSDRYGNKLKTNTVRLYMGNPLAITAQPVIGAAPKGKTASVTVKATGDGLTYTWYHKNASASAFAKAGTTGATYSAYMSEASNGRYVYCIVRDKYGNQVKTDTVKLVIGNLVKITAQPTAGVAPKGKTASVTVKATGDGLSYTWYHKNASASAFAKAGTTGATYSAYMSASSNGRYVYCIVRDKYGNQVKTDTVKLVIGNPAKITDQPESQSAPKGRIAAVNIKATGDGISYTWYHKNASASTFAKAPQTGTRYSAAMNDASNGRLVYCVVKDKYGTEVKTNVVVLTIR